MTASVYKGYLRDASTFGGASALVAALGLLQALLVPRLLDVTDFGFFRIFLLYSGYVGLLHLGLADGAHLFWAGRPFAEVASEWRVLNPYLVGLQVLVVAVGGGAAVLVGYAPESHIVAALGIAALFGNACALATFAMQGAGDFRWAAATVVVPPALFLTALLAMPLGLRNVDATMVAWLGGQAAAALLGTFRLARVAGRSPVAAGAQRPRLGRLLASGVPTLLANIAGGLGQSADRIILSWAVPVASFALYGFAASALFVVNTAAHALTRITLPHAARLEPLARRPFFEWVRDVILSGYGIGLVAYPGIEAIVRVWLPRYVTALPIARAMLLGTLFWAVTQIVQTNAFRVAGRYRSQLGTALLGAAFVGVATGGALLGHLPLWGTASMASGGIAAGWLAGEVILHRVSPEHATRGQAGFVAVGLAQTGAVIVATTLWQRLLPATLTYVILASIPTLLVLNRLRAQRPAAVPLT